MTEHQEDCSGGNETNIRGKRVKLLTCSGGNETGGKVPNPLQYICRKTKYSESSGPNERTEVSLHICALLLYYFLSTPLSKNGRLRVPKKHHMICRSSEKSPGKGGFLPHRRHFGLTSALRPELSESMTLMHLTSNNIYTGGQ